MAKETGVKFFIGMAVLGLMAVFTGYLFTILYLALMWRYGDPRWGLPFFWFIPTGIKGLHFHHDIEFFIITPVMIWLAKKGKIPKEAAFLVSAFFFGMALHHWVTEGLRLVTFEP